MQSLVEENKYVKVQFKLTVSVAVEKRARLPADFLAFSDRKLVLLSRLDADLSHNMQEIRVLFAFRGVV